MGRISVLFIKDGSPNWAAQGLEYDIAAQGSTIKEAMRAFEAAIYSEFAYAQERGQEVFEGIATAPQRYWDIFEKMASPVTVEPSPFRTSSQAKLPQFQSKVA